MTQTVSATFPVDMYCPPWCQEHYPETSTVAGEWVHRATFADGAFDVSIITGADRRASCSATAYAEWGTVGSAEVERITAGCRQALMACEQASKEAKEYGYEVKQWWTR